MVPNITKHSVKRIRQRLGLNKKAVEKLAGEAFELGRKPGDYSGSMRKYLDWLSYHNEEARQSDLRVHSHYVFIYRNATLITAFLLPNHLKNRKAANAQNRHKKIQTRDRELAAESRGKGGVIGNDHTV